MHRKITAAILAASMGLGSAAQADRLLYRLPNGTAQTSPQGNNQAAQVLGGLAVLGALGYTLKKLNEDDDDDKRRRHDARPRSDRHDWNGRGGWDKRDRGRYSALPGNCLRTVNSRYGAERVLGTECLYRNGVNVSRLPRDCGTRVRSGGRAHRAFDAGCLRQNGWRVARHR